MIDRNHLKILQAIDCYGSVTAAAEHLCLTQSALTHAVKKLEGQTGVKLWQKSGRSLQFTQAGLHLVNASQRILPQLERLDDEMSQFADGSSGYLSIGIECYPISYWLRRTVAQYCKTWPNVEIDVKQDHRLGSSSALISRNIDILITKNPIERAGLLQFPMKSYEQRLIVSNEHQLSSSDAVLPQQISKETLYVYPNEQNRQAIFKSFLIPENNFPLRIKVMESTELTLQMVELGKGVTSMPDWLIKEAAKEYKICSKQVGRQGIKNCLHMMIRKADAHNNLISTFVEIAKQNSIH